MAEPISFAAFVAAAQAAIEQEARAHADDRWWVLEPKLLVARAGGRIEPLEIAPHLVPKPVGRAVLNADVVGLLEALGERRCALALHADLALGGEIFAAIVLAVLTRVTTSVQHARVERSDFGTPELGPWEVGALSDDELFAAVGRTLLADD